MTWDSVILGDVAADEPLARQLEQLFDQQRRTWPALSEGEDALRRLERKKLTLDGYAVVVQLNPARRRSTQAAIDPKAVAARPCFLCPANMPPEERGVAFEDLVVLPNPYPILPGHCTIPSREHQPQRIAGSIGMFLRLAESLGPRHAALYNGPRCGASAPDHFHFQAAEIAGIPILSQLPPAVPNDGITLHEAFGRSTLILRGANITNLQQSIERAIETLAQLDPDADEPMLNLLATWQASQITVLIFPRRAHRPACYHATGPEQLTVSPAILEMCGLLVTTEPEHFARIDADAARSIYEDVSVASTRLKQLFP